jgi:hypothetical protein
VRATYGDAKNEFKKDANDFSKDDR